MIIAIDSEFIEDGKTIKPVSLALVRQDGAELYFEFEGVDWESANPWVIAHVKPHLTGETTSTIEIRNKIHGFVGEKPEFWGYYSDYDWVLFCQLHGSMIELPSHYPMYCRDLIQLMDERRIKKEDFKSQEGVEHNALADARWILSALKQAGKL